MEQMMVGVFVIQVGYAFLIMREQMDWDDFFEGVPEEVMLWGKMFFIFAFLYGTVAGLSAHLIHKLKRLHADENI